MGGMAEYYEQQGLADAVGQPEPDDANLSPKTVKRIPKEAK